MPYIPRTPESLLPRSDSKNPATTCRGMTTAGRPCRRSVAAPISVSHDKDVVVGGLQGRHAFTCTAENAALFCWQHKEQARLMVVASMTTKPLNSRNSFDTLLEEMGVLHLDDKPLPRTSKVITSTRDHVVQQSEKPQSKPKKPPKHGLLSLCCWTDVDDDEHIEIVRHKTRAGKGFVQSSKNDIQVAPRQYGKAARRYCSESSKVKGHQVCLEEDGPIPTQQERALPGRYLSDVIPQSLSPSVQAQLLAEISKPVSPADEEGYIYIFWLTDDKIKSPNKLASFLDQQDTRRAGELKSTEQRDKLLVKIGRATNVQRRLASWSQQCGYHLSLIRFYPHVRSLEPVTTFMIDEKRHPGQGSLDKSVDNQIRKVPYSHRVERLIHVELSDKRVRQAKCTTCGVVHREWFEIEASRRGLRLVDEVVSRWVTWAEKLRDSQGRMVAQ